MPKAGKSVTYCSRSTCFHSCYCILATCIAFIPSSFLHQRAGIVWVFGFCFSTRSRKYHLAIANRKELLFDTDVRVALSIPFHPALLRLFTSLLYQ